MSCIGGSKTTRFAYWTGILGWAPDNTWSDEVDKELKNFLATEIDSQL